MSAKLKLANADEVGAPKTNRASKKNKKSWRKNVDMTEVNEFLEEKRFEERIGGSLEDKPDEALFTLDTNVEVTETRKKRREVKPLKCFALLDGLPGAPDPVPLRNKTLKPEERENPIVKKMKTRKIKEGKIQKKHLDRTKDRQRQLARIEKTREEAKTRRRTKFDFDLWAENGDSTEEKKEKLPTEDWVNEETMIQTSLGTSQYTPKFSKCRPLTTATKLPSVEVPEPGASYNPALADHQDLLWKAAIVEIQKEKEQRRLQRQTTDMFPRKDQAPTEASILKEMSEGIVELEDTKETPNEEIVEEDIEKVVVGNKPKTRRQKRDKRKRMFEDQRKERERDLRLRETEISRLRSIRKELKSEESRIEKNIEKKKAEAEQKLLGPQKLSNYKYEPQEIEIKLSDELTGNLRNIRQEGSLLEDRFKSMQRRNMVEVRVKQKTVRKLKRKTFEKRSHKMGWEENQNKVNKRIRMEARLKRRKR